ncbi:MAG: FAD-binding oxidoreductase [Lachnospiraceae bacterium]|nr:FAD-binding oxidoreductase [Lachnospiraceae bacterium]
MCTYDKIIIGAGLYGLYSALYCGRLGQKVLVLEKDKAPFSRATYINQARVHMGYHYPRSLTTAMKSAGYFKRFVDDYGFSVHKTFDQVYATSASFSWTGAEEFRLFCKAAGIRCEDVSASRYFKPGMCDGAFLTEEYTYDAMILRDYFLDEIAKYKNIEMQYSIDLKSICEDDDNYVVRFTEGDEKTSNSKEAIAPFILNATYASVNQILKVADREDMFDIKYELCEIILCEVAEELKDTGITVMDGPFFSIMPFGKTGLHSLTAVTFTPHVTCRDELPRFSCQEGTRCGRERLENCNLCQNKPQSAWPYMSHLADKYLREELKYTYKESLFSMKPILKSSEVDDSRPTAIKVHSTEPTFISVLSGKINTVYDLDEFLQ